MNTLWENVKSFLKRFFPVTIHRFNQQMWGFQNEFCAVARQLRQVIDACEEIEDGQATLKREINTLQREIIKVKEDEKILYYCPHEVESIENHGFYLARQSSNYLNNYQRLVCDLDEESINTVNRILSRHLIVREKSREHIDLFSKEEQEIIIRQRREFYSDVVQITPEIFACGKYLLATPKKGMGFTETTVFIDRVGFDKLEHPERIQSMDILDLGAFIGDSALVLSECTSGNVYAFEPSGVNFDAMEKTIELNQNRRIIPVHAGIGAKRGEAFIPLRLSMGLVMESEKSDDDSQMLEVVPVVSVDEYVEQHNLKVGLIKVDVEGFEQEFLKGAERTLRKQRPALLLSMYHSASDFFGLKPILEEMNLGYHFKVHKEINEHIHYDTMLIAEVDEVTMEGIRYD